MSRYFTSLEHTLKSVRLLTRLRKPVICPGSILLPQEIISVSIPIIHRWREESLRRLVMRWLGIKPVSLSRGRKWQDMVGSLWRFSSLPNRVRNSWFVPSFRQGKWPIRPKLPFFLLTTFWTGKYSRLFLT